MINAYEKKEIYLLYFYIILRRQYFPEKNSQFCKETFFNLR